MPYRCPKCKTCFEKNQELYIHLGRDESCLMTAIETWSNEYNKINKIKKDKTADTFSKGCGKSMEGGWLSCGELECGKIRLCKDCNAQHGESNDK